MNTNKGICTECTPTDKPFASKDGTVLLQTYLVKFADGGLGLAWAPTTDPMPFKPGQEYTYYATFSKNGKVKIHEAGPSGIDRDLIYARAEALKLAMPIVERDPAILRDAMGCYQDIGAFGTKLKLIARSLEQHIVRDEHEAPKPAAKPKAPTTNAVGASQAPGADRIANPAPATELGAPRPHVEGVPPSMRQPAAPPEPKVGDIKHQPPVGAGTTPQGQAVSQTQPTTASGGSGGASIL